MTDFPEAFISGLERLKFLEASEVELAKFIAKSVHAKQVDKADLPYISHPQRVAANLLSMPDFAILEPDYQSGMHAAAWLHDVIEDSGENGFPKVTLEDLRTWGISDIAISLIELLTRPADKAEAAQNTYYEAIAASRAARFVKWTDIADNMNIHRLAALEPDESRRLETKYAKALAILHMNQEQEQWFKSRLHVDPSANIQTCPICKVWVEPSQRYPDYVCPICQSRLVDANGQGIHFTNFDASGGVIAHFTDHYSVSNISDEATETKLGYIDGIEVKASEAHFGGIVLRPTRVGNVN